MDQERILDDATTELRLGLPGTTTASPRCNKRPAPAESCVSSAHNDIAKVQVVGWPPVRTFRKMNNGFSMRKKAEGEEDGAGRYVKVSMDGAPYLRKIDLRGYEGYKDLRVGLEEMFNSSFSIATAIAIGEYVITYQDKDGDWMMAGDVPFQMLISTCKRLRIMKGSEARGLSSSP